MAGIPISGLPPEGSAQLTDLVPLVQGSTTYKATLNQLGSLFGYTTGILQPAQGGTGVNNGAKTITLGGSS